MQCIKTRIEWLKRIIAALTGTCIFGDAVTFITKDCRLNDLYNKSRNNLKDTARKFMNAAY